MLVPGLITRAVVNVLEELFMLLFQVLLETLESHSHVFNLAIELVNLVELHSFRVLGAWMSLRNDIRYIFLCLTYLPLVHLDLFGGELLRLRNSLVGKSLCFKHYVYFVLEVIYIRDALKSGVPADFFGFLRLT